MGGGLACAVARGAGFFCGNPRRPRLEFSVAAPRFLSRRRPGRVFSVAPPRFLSCRVMGDELLVHRRPPMTVSGIAPSELDVGLPVPSCVRTTGGVLPRHASDPPAEERAGGATGQVIRHVVAARSQGSLLLAAFVGSLGGCLIVICQFDFNLFRVLVPLVTGARRRRRRRLCGRVRGSANPR
jgi:hypothetical protein